MSDFDGMSDLEAEFLHLCRVLELPTPIHDFRFGAMLAGGPGKGLRERLQKLKLKDWRCDFVWIKERIMVEIEGGTYGKPVYCHLCNTPVKKILKNGKLVPVRESGRHNSPEGYAEDCRKYNAAHLAGFMVLRFTADMLRDGSAADTLQDARGILGL